MQATCFAVTHSIDINILYSGFLVLELLTACNIIFPSFLLSFLLSFFLENYYKVLSTKFMMGSFIKV